MIGAVHLPSSAAYLSIRRSKARLPVRSGMLKQIKYRGADRTWVGSIQHVA